MIDGVGLVHMNGRVYDPDIGRFLSADPFVQDITNLQAWNRYSYVLNNPLSYTDPSGFFFSKLFKAIGSALSKLFKAIGNAVKQLLRSQIFRAIIQVIAAGVNPLLGAIVSGAITAASGGSIGDALLAGVTAFAQFGIWTVVGDVVRSATAGLGAAGMFAKAAIHGVVGGAISAAQGGDFLQGFASNAIGAIGGAIGASTELGSIDGFEGMMARTAVAAVAGCAGAAASGGKCANGAVTAAFAHLYNSEATRNRLQHAEGVREIVGKYLANGYRLALPDLPIGTERAVRLDGFPLRYYDAILIAPDGVTVVGLEVKTTRFSRIYLDGRQVDFDLAVATIGGPGAPVVTAPNIRVNSVAYETATSCGVVCLDIRTPQLMATATARGMIPFNQRVNWDE